MNTFYLLTFSQCRLQHCSTGRCRGEVTKLGPHYDSQYTGNQGQVIAPSHWLWLEFFSWRIFLTCEWGTPQTRYMHWLFDSMFSPWFSVSVSHFMTFKNVRLDLKRSRWMMSGRRPIAIPPECMQRCSAHCRLMLHNPESTCISIFYSICLESRNVPERQKADVDNERLWW